MLFEPTVLACSRLAVGGCEPRARGADKYYDLSITSAFVSFKDLMYLPADQDQAYSSQFGSLKVWVPVEGSFPEQTMMVSFNEHPMAIAGHIGDYSNAVQWYDGAQWYTVRAMGIAGIFMAIVVSVGCGVGG